MKLIDVKNFLDKLTTEELQEEFVYSGPDGMGKADLIKLVSDVESYIDGDKKEFKKGSILILI